MMATLSPDQRERHHDSLSALLSTDCLGQPEYIGMAVVMAAVLVRKCWNWLLGRTVKQGGQSECLREAVTLFGMISTALVALLVYVQRDPKHDPRALALYLAASMGPLMGLLSLCMMLQADKKHVFANSHRRIVWRFVVAASLLIVGSAFSYWKEWFPGQGIPGTFRDANTRSLSFAFEREVTGAGMSTWNANIDQSKVPGWRVENVFCFRDKRLSDPDRNSGPRRDFAADNHLPGKFFTKSPGTYYFLVRLEEVAKYDKAITPNKEDISFSIDHDN